MTPASLGAGADHLSESQREIVQLVDARMSQNEARILKWFVATGLSFIVALVVGSATMGRLFQRADDNERRIAIIETVGSTPMQTAVAAILANQQSMSKALDALAVQVEKLR